MTTTNRPPYAINRKPAVGVHEIHGHHIDESGALRFGALMVEILDDGSIVDAYTGAEISATLEAQTARVYMLVFRGPAWAFAPTDSAADLLGLRARG